MNTVLSALVPVVGVAGGLCALWQAFLRWRAHGTVQVRELAAEMRTSFQDIIARGELDSSEFLSGGRHTLETRLQDQQGQLRDHVLQDRISHLLNRWRNAFASAPPKWFGAAWISDGPPVRVTTDSPERQTQVARQVEAARDGLVEVESVLDRCNQLARWVVWG